MIHKADRSNFYPDSLDDFARRQNVTNVYRCREGQLCLEQHPFKTEETPGMNAGSTGSISKRIAWAMAPKADGA